MAIVGIGTDIAEIERIEKAFLRSGESFAKRVLTEQELERFASLKQQARFLAKRFAATSKALGTGIAQGVSFHDFTISNDQYGAPCLSLSGKALEIAQQKRINNIHLSISDERHYAIATVIYESK